MVSALISRVVILVFGTLYPAYSSYKAVKNKDVKEYVKWMMYWIVFALFTTIETFADVLISWFPFYYELKIAFVVWLLSPATKGSSVLYKKFVHPELLKREQEIDKTLDKVKTQGYSALVNVGQQGLNFAVQKAIVGQNTMMNHLMKKSFSMYDISQQPAEMRVTYQAHTERIPEAIDERDSYGDGCSPAQPPSRMEYNQMQRSESNDTWSSQYESAPDSQKSYNLRTREYHDDTDLPDHNARSNYSHTEGYHYGTLPRRSASMRYNNVNTALPSRWRKTTTQLD